MTQADVRERVWSVVQELAPLRPTEIRGTSLLCADLGYDSLGLIELAGALEDEFGLPASDADEADVETVSDVEQIVHAKLVANGRPSGA